jgi:phosphoribosylamine--glycine ligase
MKILILGWGAREHVIGWKLSSRDDVELHAAPGNAGLAQIARCYEPEPERRLDATWYADLAEQIEADLVVVGPEDLLMAGVSDELLARGVRVFGPTSAAARLEGSKIWAKDLMQSLGIPTATWRVFRSLTEAAAHAAELDWRCVIKADAIAAGKGSFVCHDEEEVVSVLRHFGPGGRLEGQPGIVEELLEGQEVSVFAISDGLSVMPFGAAQDHKRLLDDDLGPNTGGMGAYSPVEHMRVAEEFAQNLFQPIVTELSSRGTPYVGVLYAGAIVTKLGPKILEFNCRFGDPEAEVLLCRLRTDLAQVLLAATARSLHLEPELTWDDKEALCVVLAEENYPGGPPQVSVIEGIDKAEASPSALVFHAGTAIDDQGRTVTAAGRVLTVTGLGASLREARRNAYDAVQQIQFDGMKYRHDIGLNALTVSWPSSAWTAEWRKPARWEAQRRDALRRLSMLTSQLRAINDTPAPGTVSAIVEVLNDLKVELRSDAVDIPRTGRTPAWFDETEPALPDDIEKLLARMQTPDIALGIDAGFQAQQFGPLTTTVKTAHPRKPD